MKSTVLTAFLALSALAPLTSAAQEDKPIKALLVIGGCCHDYKTQQKIITEGVSQRANVEWTIAYDPDTGTSHKNPVYDNPDWAKGFDVVVHDECSAGVVDVPFIEQRVLKPHKDGLPAVVLHCGEHCYRSEGFPKDTPWFQFTGVGSTGHGAQLPIATTFVDKEHAITRGLAEMGRLADRKGGQPLTLAGLAGLGDLVLTCTGDLSRNRQVGMALARGESTVEILANLGHVAEGVGTARTARALAQRLGVDMPITREVAAVLFDGKPAGAALTDLLARDVRPERA